MCDWTMNELTMRSKEKSKVTLKEVKMRTQQPKSMGHNESSPKRKIYSPTSGNKEKYKQTNFIWKTTVKKQERDESTRKEIIKITAEKNKLV